MARLPITTQRKDIDVRVVLGQSIFDLYQQIQHIVQRETPALSHFFAQPIINAVRGEITWNTRAVGPIKSAKDFSPDEWQSARQKLKDYQTQLNSLIQEFEKPGKKHTTASQALRSMLMTPDLNDSLFQVGNDLVLTQWGCYKFGTDAQSADLFEQIDKQKPKALPPEDPALQEVPALAEELPPTDTTSNIQNTSDSPKSAEQPLVEKATPPDEPLPQTPPEDDPPPEEIIEVQESYVDEAESPFFWRWLLLLILLLLLIFGFLWHYWEKHGAQSEAALKAEVAALWDAVDKKAKECGLPPFQRPPPAVVNEPPTDGNQISPDEIRDRRSENNVNPNAKVNVSLAWSNQSDLDLYVQQPNGDLVFYKPCTSSNCGLLDVDSNRCTALLQITCSLTDRPLENITWKNEMPLGKYQVMVGLFSINNQSSNMNPIPFTVQITKDGKQEVFQGVIEPQEIKCEERCSSPKKQITEFTIEAPAQ